MEKLDLGCGSREENKPFKEGLDRNTVYADIERSCFNRPFLTVCCSGVWLPFRENSFSIVIASHVLEHVYNPMQFLRECKRVSGKRVIIKIPRLLKRYAYAKETEGHIFTWSDSSFQNLLSLIFEKFKVYPMKTKTRLPFLKKTVNQILFWVITFFSHSNVENQLIAICKTGDF